MDFHPTGINVYGYAVAWVPTGATAWMIEVDEDFQNLPAHSMTLAEAEDRVVFLRERGFRARSLALVAFPSDTAAALGAACEGEPGDA
jgi:hypothetical protein